MRLCGISSRFQLLSPSMRQVTHALLTRPPLSHLKWINLQQAVSIFGRGASFDLHVLSTPPAFILSQDQTLMLKFWFQSKFAWLILTVITVVLVLFWMFSWTSRLNQKPLFLEFSGFYILFSFQGTLFLLLSVLHQQLIHSIIPFPVCQELFQTFLKWLRRDRKSVV